MAEDVRGSVKALVFDVFGTVVDWHGSILRELTSFGRERGITVDWQAFTEDWRKGYQPAMQRVRCGELPWCKIDELHRLILDDLLAKYRIGGLAEAEIDHVNRAWHRLDPWPDAVAGLSRLKRRFIIGTLSNGNIALLTNMAKHAGLPWDCILSAETFGHYKPDPEVYLGAGKILGLQPEQVMMTAAHTFDLDAAAKLGLRTAYVHRPNERPNAPPHAMPGADAYDAVVSSFEELADKLGCK